MTMHKARSLIITSIIIALLLQVHSVAQTAVGGILGNVKDPSGALVSGAVVSLTSAAGKSTTVKTDLLGAFQFRSLSNGKYQLTISLPGFETYKQDIDLIIGQNLKLDVALTIAKIEAKLEVKDDSGAPDTDPAKNAGAIVLKEKDLETYSEDPDELKLQLQALAGATPGGSLGQIYVDGFAGGRLPPKSAIREIRINQEPFSAEYDQPGFGRIEIITKPGSAQFHGLFSLRFNHSSFNSTNPFSAPGPAYHTTLFSADFGGPLTSRSSFQFDMDRNSINDNSVIRAQILDPSLNAIQFSQALANPKLRTIATFRVDYQLSPKNTFFGRYQYWADNERDDGAGQLALATQSFDLHNTEHTFQFSNTMIINQRTINESRFEYKQTNNRQDAQDSSPQISVLGAFLGGGNNLGHILTNQRSYQLQNYTSLDRSKHYFKVGGQLRVVTEADDSTSNFNGTFTFPSLTAFQITERGLQQGLTPAQIRSAGGGAEQFSVVSGNPSVANTMVDASAFFQDNWKLRPNLTFSYGLRYEAQNEIHDHFDFAPRVGLAIGIPSAKKTLPKTVLRLGVGIFYTRFAQSLTLNSLRLNGTNQQQFIVQSPDFFPIIPNLAGLTSSMPPTYQIDPELRAPYTMQSSISIERSLPASTKLAITYLNSHGPRQLLSLNINAPLPGTFHISNPLSGVRPFPNAGNIYQYESRGRFEQNQLTVGLRIDGLSKARLNGNYVLNFANSNTAGANSFLSNQFDINQDFGRASYDVRHQFNFGGQIDLPLGCYINPLVLFISGQPYNITVGRDLNGDSILNDRPTFATDLSHPSVVRTQYGNFDTMPLFGQTVIPPNLGTGPAKFALNLRLVKAFALGNKEIKSPDNTTKAKNGSIYKNAWQPMYAIRFEIIVNNVFNHPNLATPIGNLSSPFFGKSIALAGSPFSTAAASRQVIFRTVFRF